MSSRPGARSRGPLAISLTLPILVIATTAQLGLAISSRTSFAPMGAAAGDQLGTSVASAGDVNGDGVADVIVGAPQNDAGGTDAGAAYIYYGGKADDGVADLTFTGAAPGDQLGFSVASAGDVNGDGYLDVIVGAIHAGGDDAGRAYVYLLYPGSDITPDLVLSGIVGVAAGDQFGFSVAGVGDLDDDGYDDLAVGAPFADHPNPPYAADCGRVYYYYGGANPDPVIDGWWYGSEPANQIGYSVAGAGDMNGDGTDDLLWSFPIAASASGRVQLCLWRRDRTYEGLVLEGPGGAGDRFGLSVAGAGDVNGDGFADVICGADGVDWGPGGTDAGAAFVYFGGSAINQANINPADLTLVGRTAGDRFGLSVASAGDVNHDGKSDFVVGAPFYDMGVTTTDVGRADVYFGGAPPDTTADLVFIGTAAGDQFSLPVAAAGDVNDNGFDDLVFGAKLSDAGGADGGQATVKLVYSYEVLTPNGGETWVVGNPVTVGWRGHDLADLWMSFNGGRAWVPLASGVGGLEENTITFDNAPEIPAEEGESTISALVRLSYAGQEVQQSTSDKSDGTFRIAPAETPQAAPSELTLAPGGEAAGDNFGAATASIGDVNGDGYPDLGIGAWGNDGGGADAGKFYIIYGGPGSDSTPDLTLTGAAGEKFGFAVAAAGDVNRDGIGDFLVGAPGSGGLGKAKLYLGGRPAPDPIADLTLQGEVANGRFGAAVAGADLNGDGYSDLVVGEDQNNLAGAQAGAAFVFLGSPAPDAIADLTLTGAAAGDHLGVAVARAGDVDGDGIDDLIVGAIGNDAGGLDAGQAYVYFGAPSLLDQTADLVFTGINPGDAFGQSVDSAGDVDDDGYSDLIVGAPLNDAAFRTLADAGGAYLFLGGPAADGTADLTLRGEAAGDRFGFSVAGAGDVNKDGNADLAVGAPFSDAGGTDGGRAYLHHGGVGMDASADKTFDGTPGAELGYAVASAGDMQGDGQDDVALAAIAASAGAVVNAGVVQVFDFNSHHVLVPDGGESWFVGSQQNITFLAAGPTDVWLSVDGGATYELIASDVGGEAGKAGSGGPSFVDQPRQVSIPFRVVNTPTRFGRIRTAPHVDQPFAPPGGGEGKGGGASSPTVGSGGDASDSLFTIYANVTLLNMRAESEEGATRLRWGSAPAVGPDGLAGYRLYRQSPEAPGNAARIGPNLILETSYADRDAEPGSTYRLMAVNGFDQELLLAETAPRPSAPLAAYPLPYREGALNVTFATAGGLGGGPAEAEVGIYDVAGRLVRRVARGLYPAGVQAATWDGSDERGQKVAAGVYFLRSLTLGHEERLKLVVVR